jgi:hypothetical protein
MRITCPNCGGPHPKWECKRPAPKPSPTATGADRNAGSDVARSGKAPIEREAKRVAMIAHLDGGKSSLTAAITKVLSDASRSDVVVAHDDRMRDLPTASLEKFAEVQVKRRGRPPSENPKSPRAAYMRDLMRRRRADDRAKRQKEGK